MFKKNETNDVAHQVEHTKPLHLKANNDIASEVNAIKDNITETLRDMKDASANKAHAAVDYMREGMDDLKIAGTGVLEKAERRIRSKPGQSVAIAFTAGLLAKYLLGRR